MITKKDLEKFLNIKQKQKQKAQKFETDAFEKEEKKKDENDKLKEENEPYVRDKLELLTLIITNYDPTIKYAEYKSNTEKINEKVEKLKFIKDSLMIFHRNLYNEDIRKITIILDEIENSPIQKFKTEETKKAI